MKYDMMHVYVYIDYIYIYMYCIHTIYRLYIHIHKITTYTSLSWEPAFVQNTSTGGISNVSKQKRGFWGLPISNQHNEGDLDDGAFLYSWLGSF